MNELKPLSEMTTEEVIAHIKELQRRRELASEERILERAKKESQKANRFTKKDFNDILKALEEEEEEDNATQ